MDEILLAKQVASLNFTLGDKDGFPFWNTSNGFDCYYSNDQTSTLKAIK